MGYEIKEKQLARCPETGQHDADCAIRCFQTGAMQFEEVKASQSDGGGPFKLSLCASVKVSLMVM
jgi:hypothetical protein